MDLGLPGFRFHPTDEELLDFYLRHEVNGKKLNFDIIGILNIYRHDPWELPRLARIGEREWYFFVARDLKQAKGGRPSRTTARGFWKATGSDRPIRSVADPRRLIGLKKTLVFYTGRAPRGCKTDWVMSEYRLPDSPSAQPPKEDIVLCKVYRKVTSLKELEHRVTVEGDTRALQCCVSMEDFIDYENLSKSWPLSGVDMKEMEEIPKEVEVSSSSFRSIDLSELHVPNYSIEWMQDSLFMPLHCPGLEQWSVYANILNY